MVNATEHMGKRIGHILFGDTDIAGGIPEAFRPSPSPGPVYFEGWLILALSFQAPQGSQDSQETIQVPLEEERPRSILQLWDCLSSSWIEDGPILWRYDTHDVVFVDGRPVWSGTLDTGKDVNLVPGWSSECARINNQVYLRWRTRNAKEDRCLEPSSGTS